MPSDLLSSSNVSLAASGLVFAYLLKKRWDNTSRPQYPPGPRGLPVIGNLLDMPRRQFVQKYLEWGKQYGPITWAVVPGRKFVILNTYEAMSELLDKRGSNYINRPGGIMAKTLIGWDFSTGQRQGDATWKRHRKFLKHALAISTIKQEYSDLLIANAARYIHAVLQKPEEFLPGLRRILGETIAELTYGALEDEDGTDYVTEQNELFKVIMNASMGYLVDLFPPRQSIASVKQEGQLFIDETAVRFIPAWFPGAQFRRDALKWRQHCKMLRKTMAEGVERRMAAKEGRPCYVSNNIEDLRKQQAATGVDITEDIQAVHDSAFSFYQGESKTPPGSDTSNTTLKNFLLAMSLYPDVQNRARKEIDQFFTQGRSPNFEYQDQMPYIHAVVLESLRWNPPVSSGVPHASREDYIYDGYFIPKGTTVIPNLWQVSRDPSIYEDPSTFNPDRFMGNPEILDPRDFVFGFGRRICPGASLGYQLTWIFVVSILWGFEIKRPEGSPRLDQDADRFDFGLIRHVSFSNKDLFTDPCTSSTPYLLSCVLDPRVDLEKNDPTTSFEIM